AYLPVGWFCFLGMLVPVIGLVQVGVQALADRYTYLPLIGIFLMVVWLAGDWALAAPRRVGVVAIAMIIVLFTCALRTREQVRFWRDTETVFTHNLQVTPGNWVAHHNLALLALSRYQTQRSALEAQVLNPQLLSPERSSPSNTYPRDYLQEVISHCDAALAT